MSTEERCIVNGFARDIERMLSNPVIPKEINTICLKYYTSNGLNTLVWNVTDYFSLHTLLNTHNGVYIKSPVFKLKHFSWKIRLWPNGVKNIPNYFVIALQKSKFPLAIKSVTTLITIKCIQLMSSFSAILQYSHAKHVDWFPQLPWLQQLKETNIKQLTIVIRIKILNITDKNDYILYQFNNNYFMHNNSKQIIWNISDNLLNQFLNASTGQTFESKTSNDDMWILRCCPNGISNKFKGYLTIELFICYFPVNVLKIKIKFQIECIQLNTNCNQIIEFQNGCFDRDIGRYWSYDKFTLFNKLKQYFKLQKQKVLTFICNIKILSITTDNGQTMSFKQWKIYYTNYILSNANLYGIRNYDTIGEGECSKLKEISVIQRILNA